jgi:hypothetical protein
MQLKQAERHKSKLRIGLSGASGFGKTYSALLMAYGITGDWTKIALIDTENGSGDLYSHLGEYNTLTLSAPFTPERYIQAIEVCEQAVMELVIIDSITHEWDGTGGCLQIAEEEAKKMRNPNSYTAWAKVTPRHNSFVEKILQSTCHIITTVRRKQDYDMVKGDNNKTQVIKVGTKEVTRDGFEYELTLNLELINDNHYAKASKDRTGLFDKKEAFIINESTGVELREWSNSGKDVFKEITDLVNLCKTVEDLGKLWKNNASLTSRKDVILLFNNKKQELRG